MSTNDNLIGTDVTVYCKKVHRKPTGFVATCQCGNRIGALDYKRTSRSESGKILGRWLASGCVIEPRFENSWQETVSTCECDKESKGE